MSRKTTHSLAEQFSITIDRGIYTALEKESKREGLSRSLLVERILSKRYGIEPKLRPANPQAAKLLGELEARKNAEIAELKAQIEALKTTQSNTSPAQSARPRTLGDFADDLFTVEKG
jgi:hypothetical protein